VQDPAHARVREDLFTDTDALGADQLMQEAVGGCVEGTPLARADLGVGDSQAAGEDLGPVQEVTDRGGAHGCPMPAARRVSWRSLRRRLHTSRSAGPAEGGTSSNRDKARLECSRFFGQANY